MFLEAVNSSSDLKRVPLDKLPALADEVRNRIIEVVSSSGGHLASSLGAVEITIALHYCLDTPKDKIIFDVGHQAYAHKILSGRNKDFATLRQYHGISGFPSKDESDYDAFTTGHSSNAVSLATGLVCARDYIADASRYFRVAAVIGDGSLSGGLCFEGLNNAGHLKKDILVVLNTNELSIAPNVGAISTYLNKIISMPIYNRFRESLEHFAKSRIPKGTRILKIANQFEEGLKGLFVPGILFEELGFRYFGPIDGNNLNTLIPTLRNILSIKGPRLLHIITKKGKGYLPAENEPVRFHGTGPFDIKTGASLSLQGNKSVTYTQTFSDKLTELARADKKIVAVTAAMPEGTGLDKFRDLYPERFFDVGIAEGHAVCFSAGLAKNGLKPVIAVYSTFLQRAYDQIMQDVALQNLPVVFAIDRAGIVGEDGVTHQGIFDIGFLRTIPNLIIMAPKDGQELGDMLEFAINSDKPTAIRYPKGSIPGQEAGGIRHSIELGKTEVLKEGKDFAIIALGSMVYPALLAAESLEKEGLSGTIVNVRFVKPLDSGLLKQLIVPGKPVFTIEEGILEAGFGSAVSEALGRPVVRMGIPCEFVPHGKREFLLKKYGLDKEGIVRCVKEHSKRNG